MPPQVRSIPSRTATPAARRAVSTQPPVGQGAQTKPAARDGVDAPVRTRRSAERATMVRATGTPLVQGIRFAKGVLVVDGVALSLQPFGTRSTGRAALLLTVAERIAGTGAFAALGSSTRKALAQELIELSIVKARGAPTLAQTRTHAACFALLEALRAVARGPSESALRKAIDRALVAAGEREPHPELRDFMRARLAGRSGRAVFVPDLPFRDRRSTSFRPDARAQPDAVAEQSLWLASGWLDQTFKDWALPYGNEKDRALAGTLHSDVSFYEAADGDPPVKVTVGRAGVKLEVDRRYARHTTDALTLLVTFHGTRAVLTAHHPAATEHQARMIALGATARALQSITEHADAGDLLIARFARAHRFPPGLTFAATAKAMQADGAESGSPQMIATLERAMQYTFLEVNPRRTSRAFRSRIGKALELLMRSPAPVGRRTYEMIATGKVAVDELSDLNAADFARLQRDFRKDGVHVNDRHQGVIDARTMRAITASIAGYMWDDRIYVAKEMDPADIARALVHEVNHVLNESEEHYRGAKAKLFEEYRAFYAEELFIGTRMTPARCKALKERVIADYNLRGVTANDVPDLPPGII